MEEKIKNIVKINIDDCLVGFVMSICGSSSQLVKVNKYDYIGNILYRLLEKVPENCFFNEPEIKNKSIIKFEIGWLGNKNEFRKNPYSYYYLPLSKQREFESAVRVIFDCIFFHTIELTKEYTDVEYKELIDKFCIRYNIDSYRNFEALKKKHYRKRLELIKNVKY